MTPARRPVQKRLIIGFTFLFFFLLLIVNSLWFIFLRFSIVHAESFVFVFNFVVLVIAILIGHILIEPVFQYIKDRVQQVKELEEEIAIATEKIEKTERKLKDEQMLLAAEQQQSRDEKQKVEYILSRMTEGVIVVNKQSKVVLLNKAAEEMIGFNQFDAAQKQIGEIVKLYEGDQEISMNEEFFKKRVRLENPQITPKTVDVIGIPLPLIHVQDMGYMIIIRDLTDQIDVENGVEKKLLTLLAAFARELKQPAPVLSIVMENLLMTAAIEGGTVTLSKAPIDILPIIKNAITVCSPIAQERQIVLQYTEPTNISTVVKGDENIIRQVILNVLFNALYYTSPAGNVTISVTQSGNEIILSVQDTGVGIPTDQMQHAFTKFSTGHDGKVEGGVGMGLYVSRKLVELQNGKIWLDSVEGRGTVVGISFPKEG